MELAKYSSEKLNLWIVLSLGHELMHNMAGEPDKAAQHESQRKEFEQELGRRLSPNGRAGAGSEVAMNTKDFLFCLGKTESNDDPDIHLGDGGRALGRFQVHPDWVWTQCRRFGIQPALNETWDSFVTRLVTAFFDFYGGQMQDIEVAMYFHLGHRTLPTDNDWDVGYAERFQVFAADVARPH